MIALLLCSLVCSPSVAQEVGVRSAVPTHAPQERDSLAGAELRIHDTASLTGRAELAALEAEVARTAPSLASFQAKAALERLDGRRARVESAVKGLLETVRDRMEPRLEPPQRVELLGDGRIALLGVPAQHAWLDAFLAGAAAFEGLIDVQTRVYEIPRGSLPPSYAGRSGRALTREEGTTLIGLLARQGIDSTTAPRIVAFPFQEAHLSIVDQIPYVRDFERKVFPDLGSEIADPVVAVAEDGVHLTVRAVPGTGEALIVYAALDLAHVARPIANKELDLGAGMSVTIQVPEITHVKLEGRFELAPDRPTLLLTSADPERGTDVLVLLQAVRAPEQAEER